MTIWEISSSFWQSSLWWEILKNSRQARIELYSYENLQILIEFRDIWLGMIWAFSLWISDVYDRFFLEKCRKWIHSEWAIFWQIEYIKGWQELASLGVSPYKHFLESWTRIIDLSLSQSEILDQMHEKWRYNIRLAEKRGVNTQWVTPTKKNIDIWMVLLSDTTSRDSFSGNDREYYEVFLTTLERYSAGWLLFASFEWLVIAAGIFVYTEDSAIYYYGASTSSKELRKHMAPYLIQWEGIREGKRRGSHRYDFLGIASPWDHTSHLRWVSEFKEKFGWEALSLWEKILFPLSWKYRVFFFMRKIKNLSRDLV